MKNLIEALAKARATFTKAGKTATNKFDVYQYATIADYINAVTPALSENGLVLIQKESVDCDGLLFLLKHQCTTLPANQLSSAKQFAQSRRKSRVLQFLHPKTLGLQ